MKRSLSVDLGGGLNGNVYFKVFGKVGNVGSIPVDGVRLRKKFLKNFNDDSFITSEKDGYQIK